VLQGVAGCELSLFSSSVQCVAVMCGMMKCVAVTVDLFLTYEVPYGIDSENAGERDKEGCDYDCV